MAKKPSGLGRGLDELLEDNSPSRRATARDHKPLVVAKDEFVKSNAENTVKPPEKKAAKPQAPTASLYQSRVKPLYNTQRTTLKANFKNNINNNKDKDTR